MLHNRYQDARHYNAAIPLTLLLSAILFTSSNAIPLDNGRPIECETGQPVNLTNALEAYNQGMNLFHGIFNQEKNCTSFVCHCPAGTIQCESNPACESTKQAPGRMIARKPTSKLPGPPKNSKVTFSMGFSNNEPAPRPTMKPRDSDKDVGDFISKRRTQFIDQMAKGRAATKVLITTTSPTTTTTTTTTTPAPTTTTEVPNEIEASTTDEFGFSTEIESNETSTLFSPEQEPTTPPNDLNFANEFIVATPKAPKPNALEEDFEYACLFLIGLLFTLLITLMLASVIICLTMSCCKRSNFKSMSNISSTSTSSSNLPSEVTVIDWKKQFGLSSYICPSSK